MSASRQDLEGWYKAGQTKGATHMIVGLDPQDYENFPIYVMPGEDSVEVQVQKLVASGNRYDEVYSYSPKYTLEGQMTESRAVHLD